MFGMKRLVAVDLDKASCEITPTSSKSALDYRLDMYYSVQQYMGSHFAVEVARIKSKDIARAYSVLQDRNSFLATYYRPGVLEFAKMKFRPVRLYDFYSMAAFMTEVNLRCKTSTLKHTADLYYCQKRNSTLISFVVNHSVADLKFLFVLAQDLLEIAKYGSQTPNRELKCISDYFDLQIDPKSTNFSHACPNVCHVKLPFEKKSVQVFDVRADKLSPQDSSELLGMCKRNGFSVQMFTQVVHYLTKRELFPHSADTMIGTNHAFNYTGQYCDCATAETVLVQFDLQDLQNDWRYQMRAVSEEARRLRADPHNKTAQVMRNCLFSGAPISYGYYYDDYTSCVPNLGPFKHQVIDFGVSMQLLYDLPVSEEKLYVCGFNDQISFVYNFLNTMSAEYQMSVRSSVQRAFYRLLALERAKEEFDLLQVVYDACKLE